ncbi:MAG: transposase [Gemmatimonadota bacterium]
MTGAHLGIVSRNSPSGVRSSARSIAPLSSRIFQVVSDSSGVRAGRDRLSKRGRPTLRKHAFMFAMRNVRRDGLYRAQFERLVHERRRPKKEAIVILERKALRMMYRIARERRPFTVGPPDGCGKPGSGA